MQQLPTPIDITTALDALTFLPDRTPAMDGTASGDWAAEVVDYRDGAIFMVNYAGESEWERHGQGHEFVMVAEGATTMSLYLDGKDHEVVLTSGQFVIVPPGIWHRFSTPDGAKIMTITPQPTDHMLDHPSTLT